MGGGCDDHNGSATVADRIVRDNGGHPPGGDEEPRKELKVRLAAVPPSHSRLLTCFPQSRRISAQNCAQKRLQDRQHPASKHRKQRRPEHFGKQPGARLVHRALHRTAQCRNIAAGDIHAGRGRLVFQAIPARNQRGEGLLRLGHHSGGRKKARGAQVTQKSTGVVGQEDLPKPIGWQPGGFKIWGIYTQLMLT